MRDACIARARFAASLVTAALLSPAILTANEALAQAAFPPPPPKVSPAAGVTDMHVHSHPDVFGRNLDDIDVARIAKARGMRGIVLKNHVAETASRAALVMKVVPGVEVFGGVVLNKAVGGINPDAVEWMHRTFGGRGKMVWLPTFESDKHVKTFGKPDAVGLVVAPGGKVTPEMEAILKTIARENLVLGTGHVHPEEIIAVVKRARELGVKSILINHALTNVPGLSMAQAKQVTDMGAMIEVCFLQFLAGPNAPLPFLTHWTQVNAKHVAQAVKELGAGSVLISSDLGQSGNMVHPDGLEAAVAAMKKEGISDADIDTMMRKNPAKLLGLAG
jgi:microsomal dipeptidase-like Zn-dependent dipeptidase